MFPKSSLLFPGCLALKLLDLNATPKVVSLGASQNFGQCIQGFDIGIWHPLRHSSAYFIGA
jgi:hypothetical protein